MKSRTILLASVLLGGLAAARFVQRPLALAASPPVDRAGFDAALVAKGARLAAIGNCATCHTREGGKPFAGGLALSTPFGTIYSTNITPDADTGIGRRTRDDFRRALHEGIDRSGRHLYPAFPYDHFTRVSDADVGALYAFVMTRDPERADVPPNRLKFPGGQAVSPDGIRNQIEGGILQASSWTLHEAVEFCPTRITSADWSSSPILRFPEIPDHVEVHVIDRPGQPFLGTGEAAQGPTAAALANAVADATGARLRELPLAAARVKAAIGV